METTKEKIDIEFELLKDYKEKRYTIVHCRNKSGGGALRIWKTTHLQDVHHGKAQLLFALGISLFPHWSFIEKADGYSYFTLIFEALPSRKAPFILVEDIPEPGGFFSARMDRNKTEIYHAELHCL